MKTEIEPTKQLSRTALVLGVTGGIGGAVASALGRHGWQVRAMVRDVKKAESQPPDEISGWNLQFVAGDAMSPDDVIRAATKGGNVDTIVHAVNPSGYRNWGKLVLPMIDNTIAAARAAGGARIALPGTVYNYDPATTPVIDAHAPQNASTRKGRIRVALEERLRDAAPEVPSLIIRAGDFIGPGARSSWFAQAIVTPGKPVRRMKSLARGVPHAYAYVPDLAEAFARLLDVPERLSPHERLQFAGLWDADGQSLRDAVSRVVGYEVPEKPFEWWLMHLLSPFGGLPHEVIEIKPVWCHPMRLDNARLLELIGTEPHTDIDVAVERSLRAMGCLEEAKEPSRTPSV